MTARFGLAGWSGSGKTTLLTRLLPLLRGWGLSVSTLKHAHHGFDLDQPGKDSYQHRAAGAREVLIASSRRWALLHEQAEAREPDLEQLLARMSPVDLVLVEGFRHGALPKLEVWRAVTGKPPLFPHDPAIVAVASDQLPPGLALPWFDLGQPEPIARFIVGHCGLGPAVSQEGAR